MIAEDIWSKDKIKKQIILEKGFDFLEIWENEYNANKNETIKKVIKWLNL